MLKKLIIAIWFILMIGSMSSAQEMAEWSAYLFDNINYDIVRVNADGDTQAFSLGLDGNELLSLNNLAISHDGTLVAYCKTVRVNDTDSTNDLQVMIIREIETGNNLHEITFGTPPACSVTAFSEDDSQIAVSLVSRNFMEEPTDEPAWSLRLLDVTTGETQTILNEGDDIMPDFDVFGENVPLRAGVRQFDEASITFAGFPFVGMGGPAFIPVYRWDFAENTITQLSDAIGRVNNDVLESTGEIVYPALDETLSAAQPDGPIPQANVVNVMSADGTETTIYQNEEWVIVGTRFIEGGQAVGITLVRGFEPNQDMNEANTLRVDIVGRDGTVTTLEQTFNGGMWFEGVANGALFVYTPNPTSEGWDATKILVWDGNALSEVATYLPDYSTGWSPPQLLWVSPSASIQDDLPAFVPVN